MRSLDTTEKADPLQREICRKMDGPSRLRLALDMSIAARALALARLRHQHPEYSDYDLEKALLRLTFPPGPLPPPLQ
jgi:hypothetical protein